MEAKILKLLDENKVVINKGSAHKVNKDDIFMIFEEGDEIFDPDTNESLGYLEIPKLKMKALYIQEKITILISAESVIETDRKTKRVIKRRSKKNNNPFDTSLALAKLYKSIYNDIDDEVETIIEETPKERLVSVEEKNIKIGDIARKVG